MPNIIHFEFNDYIVEIEKNGGKIVSPKMPITGIGYLAYFKDT